MSDSPKEDARSDSDSLSDQARSFSRANRELTQLLTDWDEVQAAFDPSGAGGVAGEQRSLIQDASRRFMKNKVAVFSLIMMIVYVGMSIYVPTQHPEVTDSSVDVPREQVFLVAKKIQEPGGWWDLVSWEHPLGFTESGRDQWGTLWAGGRISLAIGFGVALVILVLGTLYGAISGYAGGKLDQLMMRTLDALYGLPYIPFAIILIAVIQGFFTTDGGQLEDVSPLWYMVPALSLTTWFTAARIMRGQVMSLKNNEYVEAAMSQGARSNRIIRRHLLPSTVGIMVVSMFLEIPGAILGEATLTLIGLGVPPDKTSWGQMVGQGFGAALSETPNAFGLVNLWAPAFLIATTVLFSMAIADGLRDAFDPRGKA